MVKGIDLSDSYWSFRVAEESRRKRGAPEEPDYPINTDRSPGEICKNLAKQDLDPNKEIIEKLKKGEIILKHSSQNNYCLSVLIDKGEKQKIGLYIDGSYPQIKIKKSEFIDLTRYPELETKLKKAMDNLKGGKILKKLEEVIDPKTCLVQLTDNKDYTYDVKVIVNNQMLNIGDMSYIPHAENPQVIIGEKTFALKNYPNLKDKLEKALKDLEPKTDPQQLLP
jgi:hypothetical protein